MRPPPTQPGQHEIGRLAQVSGPGDYAEAYDYDSAGRLLRTRITADGGRCVINRNYNSSGLVDSMPPHIRKSTGSPASATYYVTGDHLGSATAVMDAGGALLRQLSFAAFGRADAAAPRRTALWPRGS